MPIFTAVSSAWLALLSIPVVIFYFLKLRRTRVVVPSLVLWRQVLADQRVNAPFQRFKRNLLLWLQLLVLALLVLAAMQPVIRSGATRGGRLPVLIDVSASMAALDQPGGLSRLGVAKARVREAIQQLPPDQELCLIAFAKTARRLTAFTNARNELLEALDALQVEDVAGELDDALRLTQGLARTDFFDRVWLLSDGNFPGRSDFELPFRIDYQRLPPGGANVGIVACNARREFGSKWTVFVQIAGSASAESLGGTLELREGQRVLGSENVTVASGNSPRFSFRVESEQPLDLELRFIPDGFDALAADNQAWLHLPLSRPLKVFVSGQLASVRHAMQAQPWVELLPDTAPAADACDLVVSDRDEDAARLSPVVCIFGPIPPDLQAAVAVERRSTSAIDWQRDSQLLLHVNFEEVVFMDSPRLLTEQAGENIRAQGYNVLVDGVRGPLLLEKASREHLEVRGLFGLERSTFVYRVGFPVYVANLVRAALQRGRLAEVEAVHTGTLPATSRSPSAIVTVELPGGPSRRFEASTEGRLNGVSAPRTGLYRLQGGGEPIELGASLLSRSETGLVGVDQIEFPERIKVSSAATAPRADRSLWWPLSALALAVLAVEWAWFHRRGEATPTAQAR